MPDVPFADHAFKTVEFTALVYDDDGPVAGALITAQVQHYDENGYPTPGSIPFYVEAPRTDGSGLLTCRTSFPPETRNDQVFEVFAYEPRSGLGYREFSLEELSAWGPEDLSIELEHGDSVEGRVIDEAGIPVEGANVLLFMESHSGINLSGLVGLTEEDGSFSLSGVTLENRPIEVHASLRVDTLESEDGRPLPPFRPPSYPYRVLESSKAVSEAQFDPDRLVWEVGDLALGPGRVVGVRASVRDRNADLRATHPGR